MITIKTIFQLHKVELDLKIEEIDKEIETTLVTLEALKKFLLLNKKDISLSIDNKILISGKCNLLVEPLTNLEKYFNIKLAGYNQIYNIYENKLKVKEQLIKQQIKSPVFFYILQRFNELLFLELVHSAYQFKDLFVGGFYVIVNKNKKPVINWGISIKNKNKLLEEGKIPYTKQSEQEAKENGIEYKGEPWLSYLSDYSLFYQWDLLNTQFIRIPNIKNFTFVPYRGKLSPVKELARFRQEHTDEELINHFKHPISC